MTVTSNRLRQSYYSFDANGGSIYEEFEVAGYQVGITPLAILGHGQTPDSGTPVPTYGELRDGLPCRFLRARPIAANKARVECIFGYVASSWGAASTSRASGGYGRTERIALPVFRRTYIDPLGTLLVWRYMPEYDTFPVASRWYDGTPVALQSQDPTREQIWQSMNANQGKVRTFPDMPMRLMDWELIDTIGQVSRIRARFEIVQAIPAIAANALGGTHFAIPQLPAGGRYLFDPIPAENVAPSITTQTAALRWGSWTDLPFKIQLADGTYIK